MVVVYYMNSFCNHPLLLRFIPLSPHLIVGSRQTVTSGTPYRSWKWPRDPVVAHRPLIWPTSSRPCVSRYCGCCSSSKATLQQSYLLEYFQTATKPEMVSTDKKNGNTPLLITHMLCSMECINILPSYWSCSDRPNYIEVYVLWLCYTNWKQFWIGTFL